VKKNSKAFWCWKKACYL